MLEIDCIGYPHNMPRDAALAGQKRLAKSFVKICAIARNVENKLSRFFDFISFIHDSCHSWELCIYENDSCDGTIRQLLAFQKQYRCVKILSEDLGHPRWPRERNLQRATALAYARNRCAYMGTPSIDFDLVVVVDVDLSHISKTGFFTSLMLLQQYPWVASNALQRQKNSWTQADAWALRFTTWEPIPFQSAKNCIYRVDSYPRPVLSAFGGLTLYRANVYGAHYDGTDCEHVALHRKLGPGCINPAQVTIY